MKRSIFGQNPHLILGLNSTVFIIAVMLLFSSCGSDNDNPQPVAQNLNGPQQCLDPTSNRTYTCYPGDPNYPGNNRFRPNNTSNFSNYQQIMNYFQQMNMNTNLQKGDSFSIDFETFVIESVEQNSVSISVHENNEKIETRTITKQEALKNLFGESGNHNSEIFISPIQICIQQQILNAYVIEEYLPRNIGIGSYIQPERYIIVSPDLPLAMNPVYNENGAILPISFLTNRSQITRINRMPVNIGSCGAFQN